MKDIKGGTALILCASPEWDSGLAAEQAKKADLVICADGGYLRAEAAGIVPDVLMGDFDSCALEKVRELEKIVYPVRKDDTDLILALRYALERGCKRAVVLGCFGGRLDHTIGNLQSIAYGWRHGLSVTLMDAGGGGTDGDSQGGKLLYQLFCHGGEMPGNYLSGAFLSPDRCGADGGLPPGNQQ